MGDEHANATHSFTSVEGLNHKLVKNPLVLSSQAGRDYPKHRAPCYGEHTVEVKAMHTFIQTPSIDR